MIEKRDNLPDIAPTRHEVTILWAERPEAEDKAVTYTFDTLAELDAFMLGVTEAEGWLGLHVINDSREEPVMTPEEIEAATIEHLVSVLGYDRGRVLAERAKGDGNGED